MEVWTEMSTFVQDSGGPGPLSGREVEVLQLKMSFLTLYAIIPIPVVLPWYVAVSQGWFSVAYAVTAIVYFVFAAYWLAGVLWIAARISELQGTETGGDAF